MRTACWTPSLSSRSDILKAVREGKANILISDGVFYNPKMKELRDISVMLVKARKHRKAKLLDSTTATGIRGIRYALESGVKELTMLDVNEQAAKNARANAARNKLKARVENSSIREFTASCKEAFDIVDLDPFGSPAPYLYDLLRVCRDGTLLMVTATDTATLCGAEGQACERVYGSRPLHNELCHEAGIRILMGYITRTAAQLGFGIEPMLSISAMHYMRTFVTLKKGAKDAVDSVRKMGFGTYCWNCHEFSVTKGIAIKENRCNYCKKEVQNFGPIWISSIQDKKVLARMLKYASDYPDAVKLLKTISEEVDTPFFYSIPKITSHLGISSVPQDKVLEILRKRGTASKTHFEDTGIKTDADINEIVKAVKMAREKMR